MRPDTDPPPPSSASHRATTLLPSPSRGPGRVIGGYELVDRIGAGGMGEVWKARDRVLGRVVALKFLSVDAQRPAAAGGLLQEARAASALNHPNIVTIFQIGESGSDTYLAMEFVDGEALRARLQRGQVPLDEAVEIAGQIVDGLASAHQQGILHRDLKPENIMLRRDGRVKLVDFGLAKVLPFSDATTGTTTVNASAGRIVGTATYMSPEQARGCALGTSSDVFALGIVLYELISGAHPFRAETVLDTLHAILDQEPPDLGARCAAAPAPLVEVVWKSLRKDPGDRFASAIEVRQTWQRATAHSTVLLPARPALRHKPKWMQIAGVGLIAALVVLTGWSVLMPASGEAVAPAVTAVAIRDLRADEGDRAAALLADSLPEDLGVALSAAGFQVASRTSVRDADTLGSARLIGEQLGVDALVDGRVRRAEAGLRVYIELVSVRTPFQIWSGTFTTEGTDVVGGDPRLAAEIARQIRAAVDR